MWVKLTGSLLYGVPARLVACVAEVDEGSELVHLLDDAFPEDCEASVLLLAAAGSHLVLPVVGELHGTEAVIVCDLQEVYAVFEERAVLGTVHDAVFAILLGAGYVGGLPDDGDPVAVLLGPVVVLHELLEGVGEAALHADGEVGGG